MFDDAGPGMIQDPVSILAYLAAVGVVFQLGRLEAVRPLWISLSAHHYPHFVLLGVVVIAPHAAVLHAGVRLLRTPLFLFGAASQTCIGVLVAQLLAGVAA